MGKIETIRGLVAGLPWGELRDAYDALLSQGHEPGDAAATVARLVDDFVDWQQIAPGAAGAVLEAIDRPLVRLVVSLGLRYSRRGA